MPNLPAPMHTRLERLADQWRAGASADGPAELPGPEFAGPARVPRMDARSWRVLVALGLAGLVVVGWMWFQGRPRELTMLPESVAATPTLSSDQTSRGAGEVVVHVTGAVRKPGLVRLPPGSRINDAIEAAGGVTQARARGSVNLARVLVDGEQVVVSASGTPPTGATDAAISINAATAAQLEELPGVGPVLAQSIVAYRTAHGTFAAIDELDDVSGIGAALLSRFRSLVTL